MKRCKIKMADDSSYQTINTVDYFISGNNCYHVPTCIFHMDTVDSVRDGPWTLDMYSSSDMNTEGTPRGRRIFVTAVRTASVEYTITPAFGKITITCIVRIRLVTVLLLF